jgi:enoyl-CoA hydratase/carnithine racemase
MSDDRIRIEVADHVASVAMIRSDKHNALDGAMFEGLVGAAERVAHEPGVRAVVLYGDGPSFCSGIDVGSLSTGGVNLSNLAERDDGSIANLFQRAAYDWTALPVPVIAAVHGNCFGGGMQVALGADIRIAAPDARLSVMEVKWGLVPDMAITVTLPRLLPADVAKELTFTGRILSGTEAHALGLVTRLADDPLAAARALAAEIATKSPDAIRAAKRLYNDAWAGMAPAEGLLLESRLQQDLLGSPNQMAAVTAGMRREQPQFVDPDLAPAA